MAPIRRSTLVAAALLCLGCADGPRRPSATAVGMPGALDLRAILVQPSRSTTALVGGSVPIFVRGEEPAGRLEGIGFIARRLNGDLVDSLLVRIDPTDAATERFSLALAAELPNNTQIDLEALALGPDGVLVRSEARSVIALRCPANAAWC